MPMLREALAGRMECLYLRPLTEAEKEGASGHFLKLWRAGKLARKVPQGRTPGASALPARLVEGGYPEACARGPKRARRWRQQYLQSSIERDIQDLADIRDSGLAATLADLRPAHWNPERPASGITATKTRWKWIWSWTWMARYGASK